MENEDNTDSEWVIVKNEKGLVKTATCEENETAVYDKTRDWVVTECDPTKKQYGNKNTPKNIAKFFIRDLLCAKEEEGCFNHKDIQFVSVFICGQVVDKYASAEYYFIDVDDGTSAIKCLISVSQLAALKESNRMQEVCKTWIAENEHDSKLLKAAKILISSYGHIKRTVPDFHELELGDTVSIIGTLRQYNYGRNVFIKKIHRDINNPLLFASHLAEMVNLYREVYN